VSTFR